MKIITDLLFFKEKNQMERQKSIQTTKFTVSERASMRILQMVKDKNDEQFFRIAVNAGGCSGFQYEFLMDDKPKFNDIIIEKNGAKVVVDDISIGFLENAELDWVDELIGSAFKITNPNARSSCGCGMSFAV